MASESIAHLMINGHRPRVAIVGGSPAGTTVASVLVERFGAEPVPAAGGEAILALLRRDAAIDVILIDLSVPDMDGIVAVQLIRTLGDRGDLPIVALTDDRAQLSAPRTRGVGFAGCVMKPYSPRELYLALDAALSRTPPFVMAASSPEQSLSRH